MLGKLLLIFTFIILPYTTDAGGNYQFNFNIGMDNPQSTDTRSATGYLAQFHLSTKPNWVRLISSFTYITAGTLAQGEFGLGGNFYPLAFVGEKSPIQPFVMVGGVFGLGSFEDTTRMDTGYGMGVGCDINFYKSSGFTVMIEQHNATESSMRTYVGYFWK